MNPEQLLSKLKLANHKQRLSETIHEIITTENTETVTNALKLCVQRSQSENYKEAAKTLLYCDKIDVFIRLNSSCSCGLLEEFNLLLPKVTLNAKQKEITLSHALNGKNLTIIKSLIDLGAHYTDRLATRANDALNKEIINYIAEKDNARTGNVNKRRKFTN